MKKSNLKSIGAVAAGFIAVALLSTLTDLVLTTLHIFPTTGEQALYGPSTGLLLTALIYRSCYTVLGGYITAMLAPKNPMKLVNILGIIGTIAATIGVIAGWNLSAHWYPIALAVTAFPLVWLGGKLRVKK